VHGELSIICFTTNSPINNSKPRWHVWFHLTLPKMVLYILQSSLLKFMAQNQGGTSSLLPDFEIVVTFSRSFRPARFVPPIDCLRSLLQAHQFFVLVLMYSLFVVAALRTSWRHYSKVYFHICFVVYEVDSLSVTYCQSATRRFKFVCFSLVLFSQSLRV